MLLSAKGVLEVASLNDLLARAELNSPDTSYGQDIDAANTVLLDPLKTHEERHAAFLAWAARYQPCLFGRFGSREMQGIGIDTCWIDENEIALGDGFVSRKIQKARQEWKERAAAGIAHGFLIMFNGPRLARLKPGIDLLEICERIADLYLIEHAPIKRDVIYTESVPLRGASLSVFKAGINIFYPSAHRTRNHDRRIPGGLMISVNSPGHWANSLVMRGLAPSLDEAVGRVLDIALRSIGNGGIGHDGTPSASWHNRENNPDCLMRRRQLSKLPHYVPEDYSQRFYSALYHTDVLVPTDVTIDGTIDPDIDASEHWNHLIIDYISEQERTPDHINYALFHGHPIPDEALYHNPWSPRRAVNSPLSSS
ncbi:hypothetical protein [Rhodopseudomonas pseudopalustris]|uniref:Uncharacterized protein n=2 Tax=Rhodopseudomonas TaxID=1073 RepID=Q13DR0_RHOPS|nr:hypothetical protein [Rhodopseudomonas pseudopalustris]ABE37779.1 hypothetical protein RPD_0541 [Rhodopseudomonas palustris BisB5]SEP23368.1 hypothetical protein SAMN05444123_11147 [Rhodopseudomonas pseudopalustris]